MECSERHLKLIAGIFEILFTAATFGLSFAGRWDPSGGGYVDFCGIACFLFIIIWLILTMVSVIPKTSLFFAIELAVYCLMVAMLLAAGILAAVIAAQLSPWADWLPFFFKQQRDIIAACSFFAFASAILCGLDIGLQVQQYRAGNFRRGTTSTDNTATGSTTTCDGQVAQGTSNGQH